MGRAVVVAVVALWLVLAAAPASAQETPEPPATVSVLGLDLTPLVGPVLRLRDLANNWPVDFQAQLHLWLEQGVTYVGNRIWEAVGQQGEQLLREVTTTNDFTRILGEIPAEWTYRNPIVWGLWGLMTGCFLAFMGLQIAATLSSFQRRRQRGAPWGDLFDEGFDLALGVGAAVSSPIWSTLGLLVINVMAVLIVQDSTVLPGLPRFANADEAVRNAALLAFYAILAFLLLLERIGAVAVLMVCLVFSGWGLGSYFWPLFGTWYKAVRGLAVTAAGSLILQNVLFRLGGETINRVLRDAPAASREGNFLGLTLGMTCLVLALLAPALLGGAYAIGAVPRLAGRMSRLGGVHPGRMVVGAVARSTTSASGVAARAARGAATPPSVR